MALLSCREKMDPDQIPPDYMALLSLAFGIMGLMLKVCAMVWPHSNSCLSARFTLQPAAKDEKPSKRLYVVDIFQDEFNFVILGNSLCCLLLLAHYKIPDGVEAAKEEGQGRRDRAFQPI